MTTISSPPSLPTYAGKAATAGHDNMPTASKIFERGTEDNGAFFAPLVGSHMNKIIFNYFDIADYTAAHGDPGSAAAWKELMPTVNNLTYQQAVRNETLFHQTSAALYRLRPQA